MPTIGTEGLRSRSGSGNPAVFDARGDEEFGLGHIPNAEAAPPGSLVFRVARVMNPDSFVAVYSAGGDRGHAAPAAQRPVPNTTASRGLETIQRLLLFGFVATVLSLHPGLALATAVPADPGTVWAQGWAADCTASSPGALCAEGPSIPLANYGYGGDRFVWVQAEMTGTTLRSLFNCGLSCGHLSVATTDQYVVSSSVPGPATITAHLNVSGEITVSSGLGLQSGQVVGGIGDWVVDPGGNQDLERVSARGTVYTHDWDATANTGMGSLSGQASYSFDVVDGESFELAFQLLTRHGGGVQADVSSGAYGATLEFVLPAGVTLTSVSSLPAAAPGLSFWALGALVVLMILAGRR